MLRRINPLPILYSLIAILVLVVLTIVGLEGGFGSAAPDPFTTESDDSGSAIADPFISTPTPSPIVVTETPSPTPGIDPALCYQSIHNTVPFDSAKFKCRIEFLRNDANEVIRRQGFLNEDPNKTYYRGEMANMEVWLSNNKLSQAVLTEHELILKKFREDYHLRDLPVVMPTTTPTPAATTAPALSPVYQNGQPTQQALTLDQLGKLLEKVVVQNCTKKTCTCPPGKLCVANDP